MCLRNVLDDHADQWNANLEVVLGANGDNVSNYSHKKRTFAFKYPKTGLLYSALKTSSFFEFVCEWICHVPDCHILHCRGFEKIVCAFHFSAPHDVINDIDEKDGLPVFQES